MCRPPSLPFCGQLVFVPGCLMLAPALIYCDHQPGWDWIHYHFLLHTAEEKNVTINTHLVASAILKLNISCHPPNMTKHGQSKPLCWRKHVAGVNYLCPLVLFKIRSSPGEHASPCGDPISSPRSGLKWHTTFVSPPLNTGWSWPLPP